MAKGPDFHKMGKGGADMDRERINLCGQLAEVDQAMGFILAIIAGVALSFTATGLQRGALCAAIQGQAAAAPAVYPLRHVANSLVVGALGFFLCLAVKTWRQTDPANCVAARSARSNLTASALVLAAALIRFQDTELSVGQCTQSGDETPG